LPATRAAGPWKYLLLALVWLGVLALTAFLVKPHLPRWIWNGVIPPVVLAGPGSVVEAALQAERAREGNLRSEAARLWAQFSEKRNQCRPGQPAAAPSGASERVVGRGGRIGRMNVILSWQGKDDLDLYVECPGGELLFHGHKQRCGGVLDVDANFRQIVENPVENIVWDSPPTGRYKVIVRRDSNRDGNASGTPFTVELQLDGQVVKSATGIAEEHRKEVFTSRSANEQCPARYRGWHAELQAGCRWRYRSASARMP
jgi:hypothetical protein